MLNPAQSGEFEQDTITSGFSDGTGKIYFTKKNGTITMTLELTPTNAPNNITYTVPEKYRPSQIVYQRFGVNVASKKNDVYIMLPTNGSLTVGNTYNNEILTTLTYS